MGHHIDEHIAGTKLIKVTGYREVGVVSNKTFWPFSSFVNAQDLLTSLKIIGFFEGFIGC